MKNYLQTNVFRVRRHRKGELVSEHPFGYSRRKAPSILYYAPQPLGIGNRDFENQESSMGEVYIWKVIYKN